MTASADTEALQARIRELEAELAASRKTVRALADRVERGNLSADAGQFALSRAISTLENAVRQRTRELASSEAHYRALYDASPDAILTIDAECRISACNWTAQSLLGQSASQLVGTDVASLLDRSTGAALTGLLWTGFVGVGESDVVLRDGRHCSFSVSRIDVQNTLLVLRDVTQGRRLEAEALRSRRLASLGRLAAALAHEISNPLAVIQGRLELLQAKADISPEHLQRQIHVLQDHCRRIVRITRNLQSFAVPRPPRPELVAAQGVLSDALSLAGRRLERIHVDAQVNPEQLLVYADRDQLAQLLANLLVLAAESSPAGCTVGVTIDESVDGETQITVQDEGRGLPRELLEELRSPYSDDLRMVDPALGLSLAICWAIAQDHGGCLSAENRQPTGARYQVSLPRQARAAPSPALSPAARKPLDILVVDDDQMLCETTTWMVAPEGHHVEAVHSAEDALARLTRRTFDAMVIDIWLPGMDGEALVEAIEARWPGMGQSAILTSGRIYRPRHCNPYLQKPFTREQLLGALHDVRDQRRGGGPRSG